MGKVDGGPPIVALVSPKVRVTVTWDMETGQYGVKSDPVDANVAIAMLARALYMVLQEVSKPAGKIVAPGPGDPL